MFTCCIFLVNEDNMNDDEYSKNEEESIEYKKQLKHQNARLSENEIR
jgi:hypothetical protein